jgi:hypothetical protein
LDQLDDVNEVDPSIEEDSKEDGVDLVSLSVADGVSGVVDFDDADDADDTGGTTSSMRKRRLWNDRTGRGWVLRPRIPAKPT